MELMLTRPSVYQRGVRVLVVLALIAVSLVAWEQRAYAHTPHDSISGIAVSPTYASDGKVFVIAANRLLVSSAGDPYGFRPIVRGLPRAPENGESLAQMSISSSDPRVMYVSSRIGGVFKSTDGGTSWREAATGLPTMGSALADITQIQVSPKSPDIVLAGGSLTGFFRTTDGGVHWQTVPGYGRVPAIAFIGGTDRAVIGDGSGRISVSDDDGATWKVVARSTEGSGGISTIAATTGRSATVFAGTTHGGLLRSTDAGATFSSIGSGLPAEAVNSVAVSPDYAHDHMLWLATYTTGVYRSTNRGASWKKMSNGLTTDPQAQVVKVSEFRGIAVATGPNGKRVLFEAGFDGLFRSDDDGVHWWTVETLTDYIVGLAVSPNYDVDHSVAISSYVKGAYLSTNSGASWSEADNGLEHEISAGNKFAPVKRLHNIVYSPDYANDHTIFSASWTAFLRSTDGGKSWVTIEVGPPSQSTVLRQFVIGLSPHYTTDHTIYLGTRQGDIFKSTESGDKKSWVHLTDIRSGVRSFAFDPSFPAKPVIFAGTTKGGVTSVDGGASWVDSGPSSVAQMVMSPTYDTDGTVYAGTLSGLFVTHDRGNTWSLVTGGPLNETSDVEAIALSPDYIHDHMMLISIGGVGLYRSTDGAKSFVAIGADLIDQNITIADFTNPTGTPIQFSRTFAHDHTIFAYANQYVLRSNDAGATWTVLQPPSSIDFLKTVDPSLLSRYDPTLSRGSASGSGHGNGADIVVIVAVAVVVVLLAGGFAFTRRRSAARPQPATTDATADS